MPTGLKATHDLLLALKPDGIEHDEGKCPLCQMPLSAMTDHPEGGSMSDKTFTEVELKAAVDQAIAEATAPLTAKVAELESSQHQSEVDKTIAAAVAEKDESIADLQAKLDAAVIEVTQSKEANAGLEQFWADAIATKTEEDAREARREERITKLRDEAKFPEEYLKENEERFVAMSDEEFGARLEEYKTLVVTAGVTTAPPAATALTAARQTTSTKPESALHEVMSLRFQGIDPRYVRS